MKYSDGTVARLGDRVRIINGDRGVIVACLDTGEFSPDYPETEWEPSETGVIVRTDKGALVQFEEPLPPNLLEREGSK